MARFAAPAAARRGVIMKRFLSILTPAVFLAALGAPAAAWADGKNEYKIEHEQNGCKYEYKASRKGYREKLKCKGEWRPIEKMKYEYETGGCKYKYEANSKGYEEKYECKDSWDGYAVPPPRRPVDIMTAPSNAALGIPQGRCDHALMGKVLGGIAGAAVGAQVGKGKGQIAAVIGGTVAGLLVGGSIGQKMDAADQNCVGQALEQGNTGQPIAWNNPGTGGAYRVTPGNAATDAQGRYCREYTADADVGGAVQQTYGKACRQPDGSWQIVR
jgi:surface antigen